MPHSYAANRIHVVFSTRERRKQIAPDFQPKLWAYIAGIGRNHDLVIHEVGGWQDHAHILFSLPATMTLAKAVQTLKVNSSKWVRENGRRDFGWQDGYGAFSVSQSNLQKVASYIRNQQKHHRKLSFEDEFRTLLRKHGLQFDERFIFG